MSFKSDIAIYASIGGGIALIGAAVDYLLSIHHRNAIHTVMVSWYFKLGDTKLPDIAKLMANWTLNALNPIITVSFLPSKIMSILLIIISSILLTAIFYYAGATFDFIFVREFHPPPWFSYFVVNFPFDYISILISFKILEFIRKSNFCYSMGAIVIDILLAGILTIACAATMSSSEQFLRQYIDIGFTSMSETRNLKEELASIIKEQGFSDKCTVNARIDENFFEYVKKFPLEVRDRLSLKHPTVIYKTKFTITENERIYVVFFPVKFYVAFSLILLPFTTFVPTLIYGSFLIFLLFGKLVVEKVQKIVVKGLDKFTHPSFNKDPRGFMPATLFALLVGAFIFSAGVVIELFIFFAGVVIELIKLL